MRSSQSLLDEVCMPIGEKIKSSLLTILKAVLTKVSVNSLTHLPLPLISNFNPAEHENAIKLPFQTQSMMIAFHFPFST